MNTRKSEPQSDVSGNAKKHDSYREAWSRIKLAQESNFFLEAITVEESIISDRLISLLSSTAVSNPITKNKHGKWPSFGQLIQKGRSEFPDEADLIDKVDHWRADRNNAVHAIVKSDPGQPTSPVDEFLLEAQAAAEAGEKLAKEVTRWCEKQKKLKN